jgi:acyl-CoA thioesterase-2
MLAFLEKPRPIDIRWIDPQNPVNPEKKSGTKEVWLRARAPLGDDVKMQQAALAYASDMAFMESALRPHGLIWTTPGLQAASLDHAMWFHHPFNFNDWTLFAQDSPSASQGRGLVRGQMFSQDGKLLASVAQECLMRVRK